MHFRLGSMTTGEILDRGIKVLFSRLGTFFLVSIILMSPLLIFQLLLPFMPPAVIMVGFFISMVLTMIFAFVDAGAIVYIIAQEHIGRPVGIGPAISYAFRRFGDLFVTSLLVGIIVAIGLILLIVPGIIFYLWYALATQVVMLERRGGTAAMSRSKFLTEGFRGRIFGIYILITLLSVGVTMLVERGLGSALPMTETVMTGLGNVEKFNATNYIIIQILNFIVQVIFSTYMAICLTLVYFDIRVRKEAFDLELVARQDMNVSG
jgi:hypothetical protein